MKKIVRTAVEQAIAEAKLGLSEGGIPIGAVLIKGSDIIGRGHNRRIQCNDPTAHGEIECLRNAGRFNPDDTTLVTTLSPCPMCAGAALIAGVKKVIILDKTNYDGRADLLTEAGVEVEVLEDKNLVKLFRNWTLIHPELWNEDGNWKKSEIDDAVRRRAIK